MTVATTESIPITDEKDVVEVRKRLRDLAFRLGFSLVDQTKLVTAASELARNSLVYGGGGHMIIETLNGPRVGIRLCFDDKGPGIDDIELALRDGYTTGSGLGLGLGGAKRLTDEFSIVSKKGQGTKVTVTKWK